MGVFKKHKRQAQPTTDQPPHIRMRFIPLDLDNFTAISQQVDDVVNRFKEFASQGPEAVEPLREAIEQRVDDLENFYYENDLDERAILFEKQRLKLRKLLRDYSEGTLQFGEEPGYAPEPAPAQQSKYRPQSAAGSRSRQANSSRGPAKSQKSDPNALVHSSAVKDKKLRVAPIYDWELRSSAKPQAQPQQQVPEGFEFQVKLSKEEFETLMERRSTNTARGRSFLQKGQGKTMSSVIKQALPDDDESSFVTSQGPYIEPTYFDNWRDTNKAKWVSKGDFKRNGLDELQPKKKPFAKTLQLTDFLHQGPYVEASSKACMREDDKSKWVADSSFRRHC